MRLEEWRQYAVESRMSAIFRFQIKRSGVVVVADGKVQDDGVREDDLAFYRDSELHSFFNKENYVDTPIEPIAQLEAVASNTSEPSNQPKKRGRAKKSSPSVQESPRPVLGDGYSGDGGEVGSSGG